MSEFYTSTDHFVLIPALMLALFGCAVLLFDFFIFPEPKQRKWLISFLVIGLAFTGAGLWRQQSFLSANGLAEITAFNGTLTVDGFALFFNWLFIAISLVVALVSYRFLEIEGEHHGEYYGLILLAQCGMYFMATGTDLITLFVGLEQTHGIPSFLARSRAKVLLLGDDQPADDVNQHPRESGGRNRE